MLYNIFATIVLGIFFGIWTVMALAWCGATIEEIRKNRNL